MLALILSTIFSFAGVAILGLFCTIPAAVFAKLAINTNDINLRIIRLKNSLLCSVCGCIIGSLFSLIFATVTSAVIIVTTVYIMLTRG
jgi:hypothetical protein